MLIGKSNRFKREVIRRFRPLKGGPVGKGRFDAFIKDILGVAFTEDDANLYGRDGFAYVNELSKNRFQIVAFQINSFGPGVFGESVVKYVTPILMTVSVQGRHRHAIRSLKDSSVCVEDVYLGKGFCGSKGKLCNRNMFNKHTAMLLLDNDGHRSFNHHLVYQLMNANFVCHHIAEVLGYAFGALDVYWRNLKTPLFLVAGSRFSASRDSLSIDVIDDFSSERMVSRFRVPHYAKLMEDAEAFREQHDVLHWDVMWRGETESFYLPVGYQKVAGRSQKKNVNVVTTQHVLQHMLKSYYKRQNAFVVASTFQTLQYLSRGFLARLDGKPEECADFIRSVTACMGYYPERDFEEFWKQREGRYTDFESEYSHSMFFRPPVLD